MFGLNKNIFFISLIASIISIILAVALGIIEFIQTGSLGAYNPSLAVLTITLIAIIWYTAYTSQSILMEKKREDAKTTSLATAILGELNVQFYKYQNLAVHGNYSSENDDFNMPVLENIIKSDISYLPKSITESISTFFYKNQHLISKLESNLTAEELHRLRGNAADLANHICEIVRYLKLIGGVPPETRDELPKIHGGAVLPRNFPENPFNAT